MSFSYQGNPALSNLEMARFLLGDTVESTAMLQDEEIQFALNLDGSVYRACARLCDSLAARFARQEIIRTNTYTSDKTSISRKFLQMATRFRQYATGTGGLRVPALSAATKETHETDTDLPQPSFYRELHDNPDADVSSDKAGDT